MRKLGLVGFLLIAIVLNNSFARSIFSDHSRVNNYSSEYKFNPFFKTKESEKLPPIPELNEFDN